LNGDVYVIYGFGWNFSRDIQCYDIATDSWSTQEDKGHRAYRNFGGRGAWCNGLFYYGTGYNTANMRDWWVTDITSEQWEQRASIPGKGRQFTACTATNEYVYLFGGQHFAGDLTGGEIFETYMRYLPTKNRWEYCGTMPCGRAQNQIAFTIDGKVYFGLGEDENGQVLDALYRIDN
jgi:N-acetylneuraminic acid mutarotase